MFSKIICDPKARRDIFIFLFKLHYLLMHILKTVFYFDFSKSPISNFVATSFL